MNTGIRQTNAFGFFREKENEMKLQMKALAAAMVASVMAGGVWAESTAGVGTATSTVSATAKVNFQIVVPKVILLKVGTAGSTVNLVDFTATLATPGVTGTGNSLATTWTGTAPTFSVAATGDTVSAAAWTNNNAGANSGQLTCSMTTTFAAGGPTATDVGVVSSNALAGGALAHPGANTGCTGSTNFARNAVVGSDYTYSIPAASVASWAAGTYAATVTYTATTL